MNIESFRTYCLSKPGTTEETPFGPETLVLKVMGKMFALTGVDNFEHIALKVEPENGAALREQYTSVVPAYHMNKKHWNTVTIDGTIPAAEIRAMIDHSYELVVKGLRKSEREELAAMSR